MDAAMLLTILAIAGVNFGWQAASDGSAGYEYIVQVEPEQIDAIKRGDSIPIESNIPPDVTPIRKVRVVVGRGELPRAPLQHTANFAGEIGWTPGGSSTASTTSGLERYPAQAQAQAQSLLDRTSTAVNESGSAISNGVQAGMQSVQDQFSRTGSQMTNSSQNAASQFVDATSNQVRQAAGTSGVSAPPWPPTGPSSSSSTFSVGSQPGWPSIPGSTQGVVTDTTSSPGMAVTRTTTGWTSIGTNVAAPPLLNPPLKTAADNGAGLRMAQSAASGPSLAAPASSTSREPLHSVLIDPARQPAATGTGTNNWGNIGTTNTAAAPATIQSGQSVNNAGLVPVQPRYPSQPSTQQAADRWGDPWAESDPWKQQQGTMPQPTGAAPVQEIW